MYVFNKIIVNPQLPKRIEKLSVIANNLWWSWNTEFLKLFRKIDNDLWEKCGKNPIKFLREVSQDRLEAVAKDLIFLHEYDKNVENFEDYMNSKDTWFAEKYPENKKDLIAYFSAEYGLDQTIAIYSGGLGILSGDHLKSASDLGIPLVAVGLLYKNGYFNQRIDKYGMQQAEYRDLDLYDLPINPVKDVDGNDLMIYIKFPRRRIYLKVWEINVGRIKLYLMDSDIDLNNDEDRDTTARLYGGDQEMRIRQEIILGMGGVNLLRRLGLNPTIYHMNEGHSAFLNLEVIKNIIKEKQVSFEVARDITSSKTVFTTHTPVPAGNDIFPIGLVEKYFKDFWPRLGLSREEFLKLGMKPQEGLDSGFNMGIFALKIAGKKNGVSKLHGEVSRELFSDVWPHIAPSESPITYVTNGVHTCTWLAPKLKDLYNKLGYIPQRAVMFNGTVSSNIAYGENGKGEITKEKIKDAVKVAQAEEFVSKMENTYDAHIAQGGTNVSGGQKQRLSIARAIARDPEIYIFDDSFSALDYKTDSVLRKELKKYTKDATILIVAQRIGTIMNADKIIVLDNGKCAGIGTHKELLKTCDVYKEIALSQLSKEELENE